jgi:hypothetical protein
VPARVYNPDHTAWIRRQLRTMAVYGTLGLIIAGMAAAVTTLVGRAGGGAWPGLVPVVWAAVGILTGVSVADLVAAALLWRVYQRRRADLDAQGAEIDGERRARLANAGRTPKPDGRTPEPDDRTPEPDDRASEPDGRTSEP